MKSVVPDGIIVTG